MDLDSRLAELGAWSQRTWADGVQIGALRALDVVAVRTRNSVYRITVISADTGAVLVQGGQFFRDPTPAVLAGSSLGGSFLKRHGIYPGFQMELVHQGQCIVTTRVRSIRRVGD